MRVYSIHFGGNELYARMAQVLEHSIKKNSPNTPLVIHRINELDVRETKARNITGHDNINALKTKYHNEVIQQTPDGEFVCMLDLDMAVYGDLSEAEGDYDLGYTVRNQKARINSGTIFVRVSEKTKIWYNLWYATVCELLKTPDRLRKLKRTYSGINQTALGLMLIQPHDLTIKEFPAMIWNCTPLHYGDFNPSTTKILHLLNNGNALNQNNGKGRKVADAWLKLEKEISSARP